MNKSTELDSTFIEVLNPKKTMVIVRCIYFHRHMDVMNLMSNTSIIYRISYQIKARNFSFTVNFNTDLLKYDRHSSTNEFLNSLSFHMLLPHIIQPTIIVNNSEVLMGNIYSNEIALNAILNNLTAIISNHLPRLVIATDIFFQIYLIWFKLDQENFIIEYLSLD